MTKLDAQTIPKEVSDAFQNYSTPKQPKSTSYRPTKLTDDEINLLSTTLEICTNDNGYLYLNNRAIAQPVAFEAVCFTTDCMGKCTENKQGELVEMEQKTSTINTNFSQHNLSNIKALSKGYANNDPQKKWWHVWKIDFPKTN